MEGKKGRASIFSKSHFLSNKAVYFRVRNRKENIPSSGVMTSSAGFVMFCFLTNRDIKLVLSSEKITQRDRTFSPSRIL